METERCDSRDHAKRSSGLTSVGLAITADVTIDHADGRISIRGEGSSLCVEVPDVAAAIRLIRRVGRIGSLRTGHESSLERNGKGRVERPGPKEASDVSKGSA